MATPFDAPYKLAQAEAASALRASRRTARIDRTKLVRATYLAAAAVKRGEPGASQRLASLWSMLRRSERLALTGNGRLSPVAMLREG